MAPSGLTSALISADRRYRYALSREWLGGSGRCLFVMLNPSTADAHVDDPTIRRCVDYAQSWGYRRLEVGNLYALRAADPNRLLEVEDPVGPDNGRVLTELAIVADLVVCAWGAHKAVEGRAEGVLHNLRAITGDELYCLGVTAGGHPRHPLYLRRDVAPVPF